MLIRPRSLAFHAVLLASLTTSLPTLCTSANAQERVARSVLVIEEAASSSPAASRLIKDKAESGSGHGLTWSGGAPTKLASMRSDNPIHSDSSAELVRDRFPNGKVSIERHVALDASGNYVNHGEFRQFNDQGELLVTGQYSQAQRTGSWTKFLSGTESALLKTYPYNKLKMPLVSTVEFDADQMHGVWIITDRDKRVACQIELQHGQRHGLTTIFHPNGQIYQQFSFDNGVLEGVSIEKSAEGKVVREESYLAGRKQIVETDYHANKSVKSVSHYVTGVNRVATRDDWMATTLASTQVVGDKERHGEFITYHDNGKVATKSNYEHGQLHGVYENWFRTGELAASGTYHHGQQDGNWVWRHANGMKRAVATYNQGELKGELRSWDEQGKAQAPQSASNSKGSKMVTSPVAH